MSDNVNRSLMKVARTRLERRPMHVKLDVTDDERAMLKRAADEAGETVVMWATLSLIQVAEIEGRAVRGDG